MAEHREMDVRRAPGVDVVAERVGAGLHRAEGVAALAVRDHAPAAAEVRVDGGKIDVVAVPVAPAGVGLPHLHQRARHRTPTLVQDAPVHDRPLPDRLAGFRGVQDQVIVERPQLLSPEHGTRDLRQRVLQRPQREAGGAQHAGLVVRGERRRVLAPVALDELVGCHIQLLALRHAMPPRRSAARPGAAPAGSPACRTRRSRRPPAMTRRNGAGRLPACARC